LVKIIHAAIKGRARYKVRGLYRSESLKKHIEFRLSGKEGIISFTINALTGNILVFFNSDKDVQTIASVIKEIVIEHKEIASQPHSDRSEDIYISASKKRFNRNKELDNRRKVRKAIIHSEYQISKPWHLMNATDVIAELETSKDLGLSSEIAKERLKKYGPNILPESVPRSGFSIFIDQFKSLPVALLAIAAGISILTGGIADALVIMGVVVINAVIGYATESQAEKTIHSLKNLVRPSALVIRDGSVKEIGAEQVVPGDILVLRPGNYVAADARLIEAHHLSIDESALTGESMPVVKSPEALNYRFAENHNSFFQTLKIPNLLTFHLLTG